jgi:hypothetical protein
MSTGSAYQEPVQGGALVARQCAEKVVLGARESVLGQEKFVLAVGRELHDVSAAVGRIAATRDEAPLLQLVEQPDDVAGVKAQDLG